MRGKQLIQNTAASTDDPRLADHNHAGAYGMADAGKPAGVIRGAARVQNTHVSIDDARVGVDLPPRKNRRLDGRGVEKSSEPAHAVIAEGSVSNTKASVSDARVATSYERGPGAKSGILGVQPAGDPSKTILGAATVRNSPVSAADPRLTCTQRSDAYGVQAGDEPSATIVGNHCHDNVRGSLADARLAVELDHTPRRGTMGVQVAAEPADTVRGNHSIRQAPGAVQDPRVAKGRKGRKGQAKPKPARLEVFYDDRGWPVPTHELARLDDGRLVLYGPAVDFKTTRPRGDLVFRAPDGTLHRPMTDAELALLMGFPLGFEFCGPSSCSKAKEGDKPRTGRRKRIGNAVPPPTAYAIAMEMKATLVASMTGGFRLSSGDVWVTPYTGALAA